MADPVSQPLAPPIAAAPIATDQAIRLARTGIRQGAAVRWTLMAVGITGIILSSAQKNPTLGAALSLGAATAWVMLVVRSIRRQQELLGVPMLIEHHQQEQADRVIADSLRTFTIFRAPRVQALQHLAFIRHGQRRAQDAARLASELLRYRLNPPTATAVRLLSAESALDLNDLHAAHAALSALPAPASLAESMKLMQLQTDYCVRTGAWSAALENLPWKIELAELLPTESAAWVQALLALAAMKQGLADWRIWLQRRAELLVDRAALVERQPLLSQLFE